MIVATAGHVDHGKTSLVRNLTGVETDRLAEEQRRGLSISLGYAYWRPDDDTVVGFIDVPGHRRFINNMISGISGIDLGMLVVASDDGPMPQTFEHLRVMELLGVKQFLLVISKCDRVDAARVDEVCREAAALLPPETGVYRVSNTTEAGIDALRVELERQARAWQARATSGHFRMSVDRAFNLQGRGLVLTGTVASGRVAVGDSLLLQPQGQTLRVRGIHAQDAPAENGNAGERCAINVSGDVHKDDVERGDWLAGEDCIKPTRRFDTRIRLLPDAAFPLKHLAEVKLHIGAKYLKARLMLLDRDGDGGSRIQPGESALARLVTERPVLCCRGDRFLLRDHGETATLGGGVVLAPRISTARASSPAWLAFLGAMEKPDIEEAISNALANNCTLGYNALLKSWNIDPDARPGRDLDGVARIGSGDDEYWLPAKAWEALQQQVFSTLQEQHRQEPDETGIAPAKLMNAALRYSEQTLFAQIVGALAKSGSIGLTNGLLATTDHLAKAPGNDDREWLAIAACLRKHGRRIPGLAQLEKECGIGRAALQERLGRAQRDRIIVKINAKRYAEPAVLREFAQNILELTDDKTTVSVIELRDRMGCGRNVVVDVFEYFDALGFTRRTGDVRIVLGRTLPESLA